jgi:hypothetical protein
MPGSVTQAGSRVPIAEQLPTIDVNVRALTALPAAFSPACFNAREEVS